MGVGGYPYPHMIPADHGLMPNTSGYAQMPAQSQAYNSYPAHSVPNQYFPQATAAGGMYVQNSPGMYPAGSIYNDAPPASSYGINTSNAAAHGYQNSNTAAAFSEYPGHGAVPMNSSLAVHAASTSSFPPQVTQTLSAAAVTPVMSAPSGGGDDFSDFAQFETVKEKVQSPRSDSSDDFQDFSSFANSEMKPPPHENGADEFQAFAEPISSSTKHVNTSPAVNPVPQPPANTASEKSLVGKRVNIITKDGSRILPGAAQPSILKQPPRQAPANSIDTKKGRSSSMNKGR